VEKLDLRRSTSHKPVGDFILFLQKVQDDNVYLNTSFNLDAIPLHMLRFSQSSCLSIETLGYWDYFGLLRENILVKCELLHLSVFLHFQEMTTSVTMKASKNSFPFSFT